jgi:hypothetical protein
VHKGHEGQDDIKQTPNKENAGPAAQEAEKNALAQRTRETIKKTR